MLIVSRFARDGEDELVIVDEDTGRIVRVVILAARGKVAVGIEAPREVHVLRGELVGREVISAQEELHDAV